MSSSPTALPDRRSAPYSVEFFDLQIRFARRVAELSGRPFEEVVGCYTNLYVRLAMGRRFDARNAEWQQYVAGLKGAPDPAAWTHRVHLERLQLHPGPVPTRCFSLAVLTTTAPAAWLYDHLRV